MTEEEWITTIDRKLMLEFLRGKVSERKLRLFPIACDIAATKGQPLSKYVLAFERHADGVATEEDHWLLGNDWTPAWETACLSLGDSGSIEYEVSLIRDIFGNPFRPVSFTADWLTSNVLALARQMYDTRDFSTMHILADALEDAGCSNPDILNHCRQPSEHVRGCWVIDILLGKS